MRTVEIVFKDSEDVEKTETIRAKTVIAAVEAFKRDFLGAKVKRMDVEA